MLGRSVMTTSIRKNDPLYPFSKISDFMSSADIAFVNLENPIIENCPRTDTGMVFCANPWMLGGLVNSGVDIVNLANNHTQNFGREGFAQTKAHLADAGVVFTGDGDLVIIDENGTRFGFLGFEKSQQANPKLTEAEEELVFDSNLKVDVLIVAMHWGMEYKATALPGVSLLAQRLIELGADVVVGHHPHWVQNIERIGNVPVYYSLGNLIFDQMWSEETKKGLLVKLTFENGKIVGEERINTYIQNIGQPVIK